MNSNWGYHHSSNGAALMRGMQNDGNRRRLETKPQNESPRARQPPFTSNPITVCNEGTKNSSPTRSDRQAADEHEGHTDTFQLRQRHKGLLQIHRRFSHDGYWEDSKVQDERNFNQRTRSGRSSYNKNSLVPFSALSRGCSRRPTFAILLA